MSQRLLDRVVAAAVFVAALVLYGATVAPTVSFWDSGEFIASAHQLMVSHPPGAPLYLLIGHLVSMAVPPEQVALAVNSVSVVFSALTVLLTHLIIVALVRRAAAPSAEEARASGWAALAGGAVGALTFAATDSFWFNAVEAEVYALAAFFAAVVCWLALRWSDRVDAEALRASNGWARLRAHRHLVLIAFLFGLAIGVHLLSLLAFFFVGLIVYVTAVERAAWTRRKRWLGRGAALLGLGALFLVIYPGIVKGLPHLAGASGAPLVVLLGVMGSVLAAAVLTRRGRWPRAHLATLALAAVLVGYSVYALVFIRSQADPAIDIGDPETPAAFVDYLNRAQYGQTPLFSGPTFDNATGRVDRQGETLFPRRYSSDPSHWRVYDRYDSDWDFFWRYQVGHMYVRYFLWNFGGKASDVRNAPAITGLPPLDGAVQPVNDALRTPSERSSRNAYYLLPLLLGLVGAVYHFRRDAPRALAVFTLFGVTGLGIVIYLNQTPMQPRPRDYAYVASFFAFSLWIGVGAAALLEAVQQGLRRLRVDARSVRAVAGALATALLLAVPAQMLSENYADHDRSGRYAARDFAHNMLTSVAEDSILFTYGDNDTYPLWYLQHVEGVRPDVRVVNLSLLDTPWYIKQLKRRLGASEPVPLSLSRAQIDRLRYRRWQPRTVRLPVDEQQLFTHQPDLERAVTAAHPLAQPMQWTLQGRPLGQDGRMLAIKDQVVYNILRTNAEQGWTRPVYFSVTTGQDAHLNLAPYFQLEGLAHRVVPIRHEQTGLGRVVAGLTDARFQGFRLTNLDDPDVFFGATARGTLGSHYRLWPAHAAQQLARQGHTARSRALLDRFTSAVPFDLIPADTSMRLQIAQAYQAADAPARARSIATDAEPLVLDDLQRATGRQAMARALQAAGTLRGLYQQTGADAALTAFDEALAARLDRLPAALPSDVRRAFGLPLRDTAS